MAAPVAGYLAETGARAGDVVVEGQVVATLDMTDLRLEKLRWFSQRNKQMREYSEALARKERSRARILKAQIQQADSQLALIQLQLDRMRITAPFTGLIISGDLSQALGAPVERGDVLFEIAPLDDYRVILKVDERDVGDLALGQTGTLVLAASPDQRYKFAVTRITPISTAEDGLNYFLVEGKVDRSASSEFRPGMEGVGKIEIDERRLIWIWTRKIILWAKMFVWSWVP
jgi:multidrug resistance efflux pump